MEDIALIDAVLVREASGYSERLRRQLDTADSPELLRGLIDYYLTKGSKGALKILTTLKSRHAKDFFDKLQDCIHVKTTRLGVLRLLAFALNSQMSWLYKISAHPVFSSILHYLRESQDILVLTTSALVVAALIPLIPSYLGGYLRDLMDIFYRLATIRSTHVFENIPSQLYPHLDVAVYYFFVQLYSLFPNNFVHYLQQKVQLPQYHNLFQEYIAPLFKHVQLHPQLVTGAGLAFETSKERWCSLEQYDIATLGLSISMDPSLILQDKAEEEKTSVTSTTKKHCSYSDEGPGLTSCVPELTSPIRHTIVAPPPGSTNQPTCSSGSPMCDAAKATSSISGVLTSTQLQEVCRRLHHSYDNMLGHSTQSSSSSIAMTTPASPPSEPSNMDERTSMVHLPTYSPTASVCDTESVQNRQGSQSGSRTSVSHTPVVSYASASHTPIVNRASVEESSNATPRVGESMQILTATQPIPTSSLQSQPLVPLHGSLRTSIEKLLNTFMAHGPKATPAPSEIVPARAEVADLAEVGKDCLENDTDGSGCGHQRFADHDEHGRQSRDDHGCDDDDHQNHDDHVEHGRQSRDGRDDHGCDGHGHQSDDDHQNHDDHVEHGRQSHDGHGHQRRDDHVEHDHQSHDDHDKHSDGRGHQSHDDHLELCDDQSCDIHDLASYQGVVEQRSNTEDADVNSYQMMTDEEERQLQGEGNLAGQMCTARGEENLVHGERPSKKTRQDPGVIVADQVTEASDFEAVSVPVLTINHTTSLEGNCRTVTNNSSTSHFDASLDPRPHYRRVLMGGLQGPDPSPLNLLDRLLERGEVVHRGKVDSIPLTEMEGMNWMHFGGCPHLEEVGIMQSQVTLLHSQLLFERYQCQQHAIQSRHVLCKARGMDKAQEEVLSLREQVSCQKELILSMQVDQRTRVAALEERCKKIEELNRELTFVNTNLASKNELLTAEVERLEKMNAALSQELMKANSQICTLKTQLHFVEAQLLSTRHLQSEVDHLSQELLMLGEAHHRLCSSLAQRTKDTSTHQWDLERSVLQREKESAQTSMLALEGELKGVQMQVKELHQRLEEKDARIVTLLREVQAMETLCHEKIKAAESKYQTLVVTSQQLHAYIMELKGKPPPRKRPSHKRCKSQPTVS